MICLPFMSMQPSKIKLNPGEERRDIYDADVPGLGIRVGRGSKTFFLYVRIRHKAVPASRRRVDSSTGSEPIQKRRVKLGSYPQMSLRVARDRAEELLAKINDEKTPVDPRDELERQHLEAAGRAKNTLAHITEEWIDACRADWRPKTLESYRSILDRELLPVLGKVVVGEMRPVSLAKLFSGVRERSPATAAPRLPDAVVLSEVG